MSDTKCPFSTLQAPGTCRCRYAREVVRRGGVEYDCTEEAAHGVCASLVEHLNTLALPALGYEDDLTQTPKSVYDRILLGGLQGLGVVRDPGDDEALGIPDIWAVVEAAQARYGSVSAIPATEVVAAIETCKPPRRRRRR